MSGKKVRCTGQPQQKFGCLCPRMRTYCGDIKSSTCKDCIERGFVSAIMIEGRRVPNCPTCQCQCDVGMFFEKDIQAIRVATARKKEIEAREKQPDDSQRAMASLGSVLKDSVIQGINTLQSTKSTISEDNAMSATTSRLSWQTWVSEADMHAGQRFFGPPTTKLRSTGQDVGALLGGRGKGQRWKQNNLE